MATNKELYDESSMKTYNNIDSRKRLMYVEVTKNKFAGYRPELLVDSLSEVETDFYVCTECKGVMRNACQIGKEQNYVCEVCVKEGVPAISMVKSRNKILELQAKCPLATRGCSWNGKMVQVEEHLIVCEKFVVNCTDACDVILPKSELNLHLKSFCVKRLVTCKHCNEYFMYEELTNHYLTCLEYQVPCPNNCNVNLKRKLLDSHLELECPNAVVDCPYKKFGCEQGVLRRDLVGHNKFNQMQHFESASIFAICEMEELKQTNIQQTEMIEQQIKTIEQLTKRVKTLENQVEKLSYPAILRDEFVIPRSIPLSPSSIPILSTKVNWKFLKIRVEFKYSNDNQYITVSVIMENEDPKAPLAKWPFEGRFKLTIIDKNEPNIYESQLMQLQPRNVSKDKGRYLSEFVIAEIPYEDLHDGRYYSGKKFEFNLQIQEILNQ